MNPKIINADMYKKITSKKLKSKKNRQKKESKIYLREQEEKHKVKKENKVKTPNKKYKKDRVLKNRKNSDVVRKIFSVSMCAALLFVIGAISKKIVKLEEIPIIKAFFNSDGKEFVKDYDFKIAVEDSSKVEITKTKNITLNELINMSTQKLIEFDSDYKINYILADSIETNDNIEFNIVLNKNTKISASQVKSALENVLSIGDSNIYYDRLKDIDSIDILETNNLKIKLKNKNPYFIYSLDFPLYTLMKENNEGVLYKLSKEEEKSVTFERNESESKIKSVSFTNYNNQSALIDDFKNGNIDMLVTSSDSVINLIGKYEYSIKKVRNGESLFLLGNKNSKLFKRKEVRQATAYSLNREELTRVFNNSFTEIIDIPFIYSDVRYKYDSYAANNLLLANGWKKSGGIYTNKLENETLDLSLTHLVNKDDALKEKLANSIKEMLEKNGINLKIELLETDEISRRIDEGSYDLVLANVNMNSSPNISYLEKFININDKTNEAIKAVNENTDQNLIPEKISNLQDVLSEEIACIGIVAYDNDIIYQKYISGFDNLKYLNIFDNFNNIGRLEKID